MSGADPDMDPDPQGFATYVGFRSGSVHRGFRFGSELIMENGFKYELNPSEKGVF
jgi:hypothetical protein